jgi:uncharacterized cupredoxin-like copper-binding protein
MHKRNILGLEMILLLAGLLLSACGGGPGSVKLGVEMKEFAFEPSSISIPASAQVNLDLTNSGTLEHEFVIMKKGQKMTAPVNEDELEPNVFWEHELEAGVSETLQFQAPSEPGEYQIICGIAGHLEQGMEGTLMVTE